MNRKGTKKKKELKRNHAARILDNQVILTNATKKNRGSDESVHPRKKSAMANGMETNGLPHSAKSGGI